MVSLHPLSSYRSLHSFKLATFILILLYVIRMMLRTLLNLYRHEQCVPPGQTTPDPVPHSHPLTVIHVSAIYTPQSIAPVGGSVHRNQILAFLTISARAAGMVIPCAAA